MAKKTTGSTGVDREVQAISTIFQALNDLDGESIQRVLDYVLSRLSLPPSGHTISYTTGMIAPSYSSAGVQQPRQVSIRDLKDEKQPDSSNQMATLVAYYLSERAPESEKKDAINTADIEKYFKQAGFRLPGAIAKTLPNAAAAGYFEPAGGGKYRLNPVGYNLVVHGLPRGGGVTKPTRAKKRATRRPGKGKAKKAS